MPRSGALLYVDLFFKTDGITLTQRTEMVAWSMYAYQYDPLAPKPRTHLDDVFDALGLP